MNSVEAFKEKLDREHNWPDIYVFKFVVSIVKEHDFRALFSKETFHEKRSKAGNYISFTLKREMVSSDEVVDIYMKAKAIEGLIAL
jgi:uncharacterized protein (DUF1697 family)